MKEKPPRSFLPYEEWLVPRSRQLRKKLTPMEKKLWHGFLRSFRYRVLRQRPIDRYIVDFYCAKLKLVIEVDGESHTSPEAHA
jgi:very-short-patch-repair endonuclease